MNKYIVIRSEDHIAHYGVKGMKWGIRKSATSTGNFLYKHRPKKLWEKSTKKASISNAKRTIKYANKKQRKIYNKVLDSMQTELDKLSDKDIKKKYPGAKSDLDLTARFLDDVFFATSSIKEYRDLEDLKFKAQRYLDTHAK